MQKMEKEMQRKILCFRGDEESIQKQTIEQLSELEKDLHTALTRISKQKDNVAPRSSKFDFPDHSGGAAEKSPNREAAQRR